MAEEEYFRKNYPDFCYGERPLSPYWDLFQDGVEFGERQSEKKIEELKERLAETNLNGNIVLQELTKANCDLAIEGRDVKIAELEEQIEKMKCCENCKYNSYWGNELHCNYGLKEALQEDKLVECKDMDKWEIKEND